MYLANGPRWYTVRAIRNQLSGLGRRLYLRKQSTLLSSAELLGEVKNPTYREEPADA